MIFKTALALSAASLATAQLVPTGPTPGDSFREGGQCLIQFTPDSSSSSSSSSGKSAWKDTTISLMSGSNLDMVKVVDIVTGYDGTQGDGRIEYPCPNVTPNSQIYFYQFSAPGADVSWTGRFSITGPAGQTTPPANSTTSNGQTIRFGFGQLEDASLASQPLVSGSGAAASGSATAASPSGSSGSASDASASSASTSSGMASESASSISSSVESTSSSSSSAATTSTGSDASSTASPSAASAAASSQAPTSGASTRVVGPVMAVVATLLSVALMA